MQQMKPDVKEELVEVEKNQKEKTRRRRSTTVPSYFAHAESFASVEEIDQKLAEYIVREDGIFSCGFCGKSGVKTKQNLISHMEIHIEGLSYPCQSCDKTFKTRATLASHKSSHR